MSVDRLFLLCASLSAFAGVAAGAFGAHALKLRLPPEGLAVFETAARYQMFHALALLGVAVILRLWPGRVASIAGWCFIVGTVLFSGSLYLLVLTGTRALGFVTPFGGAAFLAGWACLAWHAWRTPGRMDH